MCGAENVRRGESFAALNARKTRCPQGHPYAGDNLYVYPNGRRVCRMCQRESVRRHQAKQRQAMTDENELLPCPFCGNRAELKEGIHTQYAMCLGCEVMGPNLASKAECIAAWNTRAIESDVARLTAQLADRDARLAVMAGALEEVVRLSDRKTKEWDNAKAALATLPERAKAMLAVVGAYAELIDEVFGPEREPGQAVPEGLGIYDLTTAAYLEKEARYRKALKQLGAQP